MAKKNFCRLINVFRERSELWVYMETVDIALCVLIFVHIYLILRCIVLNEACIIPKNACIILNNKSVAVCVE